MGWQQATHAIGRPILRVHDLRHTCASVWLGAGADPKVVQRILRDASAAMTMDLYGHLIDQNLWDAAARIGGTTGDRRGRGSKVISTGSTNGWAPTWGFAGAACRNRTDDLLITSETLYRLS